MDKTCTADACDRPVLSRAMCAKHYQRWQRAGGVTAPRGLSLAQKLEAGVDRRGPGECWPWTKGVLWFGHGHLSHKGKRFRAHRVAYEIANGPIPDGMVVRHTCDNPPCCNPRHLLVGTQADNMADMDSRGRRHVVRGEDVVGSKLTEADVLAIRQARELGAPLKDLALRYGVRQQAISRIVHRQRWAHV